MQAMVGVGGEKELGRLKGVRDTRYSGFSGLLLGLVQTRKNKTECEGRK
jgi:hypothetical protein